jgi:hypothetical protein
MSAFRTPPSSPIARVTLVTAMAAIRATAQRAHYVKMTRLTPSPTRVVKLTRLTPSRQTSARPVSAYHLVFPLDPLVPSDPFPLSPLSPHFPASLRLSPPSGIIPAYSDSTRAWAAGQCRRLAPG